MSHKSLLRQLNELAQSPATFSSGVLGTTQASIDKKKGVKNTKFNGKIAYENEEVAKIDRARSMLKTMLADEDFDRQQVLAQLMQSLDITEETATSYFQRIAKEMGLTNTGSDNKSGDASMAADEENPMQAQNQELAQPQAQPAAAVPAEPETPMEPPEGTTTSEDPDKQGAIRVIQNAHLVYKRQNEEGTFTELWVYNIQSNMSDELEIRRDILAGTDIPPKRQTSEDGQQAYRLTTMGNAQLLEITGLPQ